MNTKTRKISRSPRIEPVEFACLECGTVRVWNQAGSMPERCIPCSTERKVRMITGGGAKAPWDMSRAQDGDLGERLMAVLHWSPSINRWLYHDGNRWVKAVCAESYGVGSEPYRVVLAVLRAIELVEEKSPSGGDKLTSQRRLVDSVMSDYRESCVRRAQ